MSRALLAASGLAAALAACGQAGTPTSTTEVRIDHITPTGATPSEDQLCADLAEGLHRTDLLLASATSVGRARLSGLAGPPWDTMPAEQWLAQCTFGPSGDQGAITCADGSQVVNPALHRYWFLDRAGHRFEIAPQPVESGEKPC